MRNNKLSKLEFFACAAIALTGASILGKGFEYLCENLYHSTGIQRDYQTLNNMTNSSVYIDR